MALFQSNPCDDATQDINLGASGLPTSTTMCFAASNSLPIKLNRLGAKGLVPYPMLPCLSFALPLPLPVGVSMAANGEDLRGANACGLEEEEV